MVLVAVFFLFLYNIATSVCRTHKDTYFPGNITETIFNVEWITCLQACHNHTGCISYNYLKDNNTCEINSDGLKEQCDSKSKIFSRGWIFHQIRPVPEEKPVRELGDHPSTAAKSCEEIFKKRRDAPSRAYYITIGVKVHLVYCKMENTTCGEGGWALAMKINGNKTTFAYSSSLWKNSDSYNEDGGRDFSDTETKVGPLFSHFNFKTGLCVGMKYEGHTKWLLLTKINNAHDNLMAIFTVSYQQLYLNRLKWKSLINGSSMHNDKSQCSGRNEGFNVEGSGGANGAKARIGLIGYESCGKDPVSRIGFGTEGSSGGMDNNNTCGNEATASADKGEKSMKAFCYILLK